jgi:hypothetical protein
MKTVALLLLSLALVSGAPIGYSIVKAGSYTVIGSYGNSTLYAIETLPPNAYASGNAYLLDLHGTRFEQGEAFGVLQGKASEENYDFLIHTLLKNPSVVGKVEQDALETLIDHQWNNWLSRQLPNRFIEELNGFAQGCVQALGTQEKAFCDNAMGRVQVLANLPGDINDVEYILLDEHNLPNREYKRIEALLGKDLRLFIRSLNWSLAQCSMFGVWGSRTEDGALFSGRNLDWNENTGINKNKLVTVFHPPEAGLFAHTTIGFSGLYGALCGMSEAGLTTHEANLESNLDSFRGFPWLLRLRFIMEGASNLAEAIALWKASNNTVGFNHMIGSAVHYTLSCTPLIHSSLTPSSHTTPLPHLSYTLSYPLLIPSSHTTPLLHSYPTLLAYCIQTDKSAIVMETNSHYTGFFKSMDPIEVNAKIPNLNGSIVTGAPLPESVFRSNHGFDPEIVAHYMWNGTREWTIVCCRWVNYLVIPQVMIQHDC